MTKCVRRLSNPLLVLLTLVTGGVAVMLASQASGGPLDPPAAPSSTQAALIYQPASCGGFPIVISNPGSYRLASDITGCAAADGIQITTANVSLDLAGFSVIGVPTSGIGIKGACCPGQLAIHDGHVVSWGSDGINLKDATTSRVYNVIAAYNVHDGIVLGQTSAAESVTASANSHYGIVASGTKNSIKDCNVNYNTYDGIDGADGLNVDSCDVGFNFGTGIYTYGGDAQITNSHVHHNSLSGIGVNGGNSTVAHNTVEANSGEGIQAYQGGSVIDNRVIENTLRGIYVIGTGGDTYVESNHVRGSGMTGILVDAAPAVHPNVIIGNVASGNSPNYNIGANNDAADIVTAASSPASPSSNVEQ